MRDFFKGWRRKAGVVLLGLACVLTTLWLKDRWSSDIPDLAIGYDGDGFFLKLDGLYYTRLLTVPFWPFAVLCTILSAVLLLWPQRKRSG